MRKPEKAIGQLKDGPLQYDETERPEGVDEQLKAEVLQELELQRNKKKKAGWPGCSIAEHSGSSEKRLPEEPLLRGQPPYAYSRTTRTGILTAPSTRCVTLPSISFSRPRRPCEPMTTRSAPTLSMVRTMPSCTA